MNNKLIIWIVTLILLCSFAFAAIPTNTLWHYYSFDNDTTTATTAIDDLNTFNGTIEGSPTVNVSCIVGECYTYDSSDDRVRFGNDGWGDWGSEHTLNVWYNADDWAANQILFSYVGTASGGELSITQYTSGGNKMHAQAYDGSWGTINFLEGTTTDWIMYTWICNTTGTYTYLNGTLQNSTAENCPTGNAGRAADSPPYTYIGYWTEAGAPQYWDGYVDEFGIWNDTLTPSQLLELYNNGSGLSYPFNNDPVNFTITVVDALNSSSIIWFSAEVDGVNYSSNSSGSIELDLLSNSTTLHNITIFNVSNYFDRTYEDYNVSSDLQAALYYFGIDNCSAYTVTLLNFTVLDENTEDYIDNSSLDIWINATSNFSTDSAEFNFSFSVGNNYSLCVPATTGNYFILDAQATYSDLPTYAEKNYYLYQYPITSNPLNVNLYLTNGTTQVTLQVRDYNDDPISDVYIRVLSYDLGTNSYTTTEIVKTDSSGDAFAQLVLNTVWYAFLLEYEGEVVLQTLPTKITGTSLTLRVNLDTDYFASYDVTQGITHDLTFTNATTTFSFTWSDPSGGVAQGCLRLTRQTINGETVLNTTCQSSTAATILMNISDGAVGSNTYIANSYVVISNQNFALDSLSVSFDNTFETFGLSGVFYSLLLILTLAMVGLWHPVAAIVLMVVGVIATNVMGIFYLNWTYIITFIILAVLTIYRVGKSD